MDAPESTIDNGADGCFLEGYDADAVTKLALTTHSRTTIPEDTARPIASQWSTRTGWVYHLRGHDTKRMAALADLPYIDESHLRRVCDALERLLPTLHHGAQSISCPPSVLRILNSTKPDEFEVKPASFDATSTTLMEYATHWKRFLCYVLRATTDPQPKLLSLSETQVVMVKDILRCSSDEATPDAEMEKMVFCFMAEVLEQQVAGWPFESSLLHFLAVHALDSGGSKVASRSKFAPTLMAMSYIAQLIILEKGLPQTSRSGKTFVREWMVYHKDHLIDESLSAVSELLSLTKYATETAVNKNPKHMLQQSVKALGSHNTVRTPRPHDRILEANGHHSNIETSEPDSSTSKLARTTPASFSSDSRPFNLRVEWLSTEFGNTRTLSSCKQPCDLVDQRSDNHASPSTDSGNFNSMKRIRSNPSPNASSSVASEPGFNLQRQSVSLTAESGRKFLIRTFHTLVRKETNELCPVCWFEFGGSQAGHPFSSCTKTSITLAYVKWFTTMHLDWTCNCHFGCGAPRFVCGLYLGPCRYKHVLSSIVLLALKSSAYRVLFEQLFPGEPIRNEADIAAAITKPSVLYGTEVTVGIVFFDAVVKSATKDRDPFLA